MPKTRELSEFTKGQIVALYMEGVQFRAIARQLGISEGSVRFNIKKLSQNGNMDNRHRTGRPRRTTQ